MTKAKKKVVLSYRHDKCKCGSKKLKTSPMCRACYVKKRGKKTLVKVVKTSKKVTKTLKKDIKKLVKKVTKVKEKIKSEPSSRDFLKEMNEAMDSYNKALQPSVSFDEEYDVFYLWFGGNRRVSHTIEVSPDMRFDVTKDGLIVSVEIEGLHQHFKDSIKKPRKKPSRPVKAKGKKKNARTKPTTKPKAKRRRRTSY